MQCKPGRDDAASAFRLATYSGVMSIASESQKMQMPQLTERQLAVLRLLHQGMSSKQVAQKLRIAEGTVKNHSLAVRRALGASNRAHAVALGLKLGLIQLCTPRS
jgi:DNA-binding NarL/FixJ family response regulator